MLNIQALKINPFTEYLVKSFERTFGTNDQEILNFLRTATSISLENIANGDMLYHNVDLTIMVASVGSEIIRGKHLYEGGFCAEEGLAFLLALLCHDIGYVNGVCRKDDLKSNLFEDGKGKQVKVSPTGTCALSPHSTFDAARFLFVNTSITRTWLTLNWFARASNGLNSPYLGENDIRELQICPD